MAANVEVLERNNRQLTFTRTVKYGQFVRKRAASHADVLWFVCIILCCMNDFNRAVLDFELNRRNISFFILQGSDATITIIDEMINLNESDATE